MDRLRFAPIPDGLPATVPFTGPETLERRRGAPFTARLGANENGFGPTPLAVEAMARAQIPTPEVLWRSPPVLAIAAVPGIARAPTASQRAVSIASKSAAATSPFGA